LRRVNYHSKARHLIIPTLWQSKGIALKSRTNLVVAIIAAAILAAFAYKGFTRQPPQSTSKPSAENCTQEAIRQVGDALERSILSAKCANLAKPTNGQTAKNANP
jgi:entry exclusion lipoprotein TrbK